MAKSCLRASLIPSALGLIILGPAASGQPHPRFDRSTLYGLDARNIGSAAMSGRVSAVAGRVEADGKTMLLVGAASGGVWRSNYGGTTFRPIFDREGAQSIGAIALDPSHPRTIWVGTGESWMRNSVSIGDGIYKSTDGGETWTNMGLANSEHISQILVDPANGDVVYACVPGRLWSDSADRGLYRTTDGGRTWALILKGPNLSTGCSSLTMDPKKPGKLIAALWDFRRKGWTFRSGGEDANQPSGSGMFVTEDGGANWSPLNAATAPGLPRGPWGREAVAIAPTDPNVVYAFVESPRSALFRSDDGGRTWKERDRSQDMVWRPFYFANLVVDPKNPDRLFKTDFNLIVSDDGGRSFSGIGGSTHADQHAVWIDPTNTKHMVTGNDGGLWISYDGGNRWVKTDNLPIGQFYHVSVDGKDPYQVYGGLQDNSVWVGDSAYPGGITNSRWENLGGGDGFWA
ncbi:MAG: WD40/YVTN/BNR-like repeat-containing protein, partial [Caulobacteraceae bacterium]